MKLRLFIKKILAIAIIVVVCGMVYSEVQAVVQAQVDQVTMSVYYSSSTAGGTTMMMGMPY
jgi:hypothetical protein